MKKSPPFDTIYSLENLYTAWHKVSLGKSAKSSIMNFYRNLDKNLAAIDHYCKEGLRARRYIRYMDDVLVFSSNRNELKSLYESALYRAAEKPRLCLKPPVYGSVKNGAPFLGFLVKPAGIYLRKKTKARYRARIKEIEHKRKHGLFTELEAGCRIESVTSHLLLARSRNFRNTVLYRCVRGDYPRGSRRWLVHSGGVRAFRLSVLRQSVQRGQQSWLPCCPPPA